jgi:integrase
MVVVAKKLPRRKAVKGHPGINYRPRASGKVGPPYEIPYLDSSGKRRWDTVHGSLSDAEARRAELRLRRRRGERIEPSRKTFAVYAEEWLARQTTVKTRTQELYSWAIKTHLVPFFGRRRIDQIDADHVASFIAQMTRAGYKGWTIKSVLRPLSIMFRQAARKGQIPVNPMSQLEPGERPRTDDQRSHRILDLEEIRALLAAADTEQNRCLIELLITAGLRIGEALGLTVSSLDPPNNLITIEHQLGRDGVLQPLKTPESRRAIDIPPDLMSRLLGLLNQRGTRFSPTALVLATRNGTGIQRKTARAAIDRAVKTAGLQVPKPTLHDLRHTHVSMLFALGHSIVDIQHRLGHRSPETTLKIYAHQWKLNEAHKSQIGQQLGQLLNAPTSPNDFTAAAHVIELQLAPTNAPDTQKAVVEPGV